MSNVTVSLRDVAVSYREDVALRGDLPGDKKGGNDRDCRP